MIHPGSGGAAKCWPLERFAAVGRELRRAGEDVLFVVGEVELERWGPGPIAKLRSEFDVVAAPGWEELGRLLADAAGYLGNDSGPTHLAALLGAPTVALFGPTDPDIWKPLGTRVRVLSADARPDSAAEPGWGIRVERVVEECWRCFGFWI